MVPKGFPKFMGNDFFLIGYRVFVRYTNQAGKNLRGLYILKSETDKRKMQLLGNIFTHYNYTTTDIKQADHQNFTEISSIASKFEITIDKAEAQISLPSIPLSRTGKRQEDLPDLCLLLLHTTKQPKRF